MGFGSTSWWSVSFENLTKVDASASMKGFVSTGETGLGKSTFVNCLFHSSIVATSDGSAQKDPENKAAVSSSHERWSKTVKDAQSGDKSKSSTKTSTSAKGPVNPLVTTPLTKLASRSTTAGHEEAQSKDANQWSVEDFQCLLKEGDSSMTLGLIDTPGFGLFIDNTKWLVQDQISFCLSSLPSCISVALNLWWSILTNSSTSI